GKRAADRAVLLGARRSPEHALYFRNHVPVALRQNVSGRGRLRPLPERAARFLVASMIEQTGFEQGVGQGAQADFELDPCSLQMVARVRQHQLDVALEAGRKSIGRRSDALAQLGSYFHELGHRRLDRLSGIGETFTTSESLLGRVARRAKQRGQRRRRYG